MRVVGKGTDAVVPVFQLHRLNRVPRVVDEGAGRPEKKRDPPERVPWVSKDVSVDRLHVTLPDCGTCTKPGGKIPLSLITRHGAVVEKFSRLLYVR